MTQLFQWLLHELNSNATDK